jgi:signal peptidase
MSKLKKLLPRLLCYLLISLVLGGTAYSWNARRLAGNAMPMPFGVGLSVVLSGSMEPTLSVNDLVVIREAESYQVGDVVVFQERYNLVIHRLVSIDGDTAVTQGDANNTPDAPIELSQIKGKLVAHIPEIGAIVRLLQTLPGTITILAIAVLILLRSRKSEREVQNAELEEIRREIDALRQSIEDSEKADKNDKSTGV